MSALRHEPARRRSARIRVIPARRSRRIPTRIARGLAPFLVGGLVASCGGQDPRSDPASATTESIPASAVPTAGTSPSTPSPTAGDTTLTQACGALNAALAGELDVVRSTFDHGPLHALAAAALKVDRGVAADLLEAKAAVESDLAAPATPNQAIVADFEALVTATAEALEAIGSAASTACDQGYP